MSGLRVFRMTWNNVLFLAGDEYEAEAVRVEAAAHLSALPETRRRAFTALDYADERLEVLPDEQYVAAFDYLDGARIFVVQTAAEWAVHYDHPLVLRASALVRASARKVDNYVDLWSYYALGGRVGDPIGYRQYQSNLAYFSCGEVNERERRVRISAFLREIDTHMPRRVVDRAHEHAELLLPAPLRKAWAK